MSVIPQTPAIGILVQKDSSLFQWGFLVSEMRLSISEFKESACKQCEYMEISLKLESMPTLCRSAFLPADTTITRRVAATIEIASSVVHRKDYCFRGIKNNNIFPAHPATD